MRVPKELPERGRYSHFPLSKRLEGRISRKQAAGWSSCPPSKQQEAHIPALARGRMVTLPASKRQGGHTPFEQGAGRSYPPQASSRKLIFPLWHAAGGSSSLPSKQHEAHIPTLARGRMVILPASKRPGGHTPFKQGAGRSCPPQASSRKVIFR